MNKVLVVDNEKALGDVMAEVLRAEGYEVATVFAAADIAEATEGRTPELIVVDVRWRSGERDPLLDLADPASETALVVVRDEPAVTVPFFGPWRIEGRQLTLRRPFRWSDFVDAVREMNGTQKSA